MKPCPLNRITLILSLFAALTSCKQTNINKEATMSADIYVAGINGDTALYWKNGLATGLGGGINNVFANSVFVSGTDVYVAGEQFLNGNEAAALWKNGALTLLADQSKSPLSYANSVFVSGSDVYVAGYTYSNGNIATYWKNQVPVYVGAAGSTANSVYVSGNDVYIAGGSASGSQNRNAATLWKNGTPTILTNAGEAGYASSVFISGSDVYVSGYKYTISGSGSTAAVYWKNGSVTQLSANNAKANSIYVSGNNVYVAGTDMVDGVNVATFWKNGAATHLTGSTTASYGGAVAVSGQDVYVAGDSMNATGFPVATIWKNGTAIILETGYSIAYALYVK